MRVLCSALAIVCSACGAFGPAYFGCDKRSQPTNKHCIDNEIKLGNANAGKAECTRQGGTVLDTCPRAESLGGCRIVAEQVTWYYEDNTTKTEADVKAKCAITSSTFVPK